MRITVNSLFFAAAIVAAVGVSVAGAAVGSGKPAPDFTLTDVTGKTHRLSEYKGKVVVLEWVNSGCPFVQRQYNSGNMQSTQHAAAADGAVWLQICSNRAGARGDLDNAKAAAWQSKHGVHATAYLRDQSGKVGRLYGAKATPHMFVINQEGVLVYQGAIDDKPNAKEAETMKANM
jgi:hypothetical protein